MTKERLDALHEMRDLANNLWMHLLTNLDEDDVNHSLNFIDWDDRRDYRFMMRELADQISNHIHDELGLDQ